MKGVMIFVVLALTACRDEAHPAPASPVDLPFSSAEAIPDARLNGRILGAPFTLRDARYVVDRRVGYEHTDIVLSAATAETPCAPVSPGQAASVWLRLEGPAALASTSARVGPGADGTWQVHEQAFVDGRWVGTGDGTALLVLREPGPDGRLSGGLAACFPDDSRSCVTGSFEALACPPSIDQPVRGTPPPERIPPQFQRYVENSAQDRSRASDGDGGARSRTPVR